MSSMLQKTTETAQCVVTYLNTKWHIGLTLSCATRPRTVHSFELMVTNDYLKYCSDKIGYLCENGRVDMQAVIDEFDERAGLICDFETLNQPRPNGKIPFTKQTKPFQSKEARARFRKHIKSLYRFQMLEVLAAIVRDEFELTDMSDVYYRTSLKSEGDNKAKSLYLSILSNVSCMTRQVALANSAISLLRAPTRSMSLNAASKKRKFHSDPREKTNKRPNSSLTKQTSLAPWINGIIPVRNNICSTQEPPDHSYASMFGQRQAKEPTTQIESPKPLYYSSVPREMNAILSPEVPAANKVLQMRSSTTQSVTSLSNSSSPSQIFSETLELQSEYDTEISEEVMQDEGFKKSLREADLMARSFSLPKKGFSELVKDFITSGPFSAAATRLSEDLPFWLVFELHRFSTHLRTDIRDFYLQVNKKCGTSQPQSVDRIFLAAKQTFQMRMRTNHPPKSELSPWFADKYQYCDLGSGKSASFSASLKFANDFKSELFRLEINPIRTNKGCRFHRHFGADRFLDLIVPYLTTSSLPHELQKAFAHDKLHDLILGYLSTHVLYFADRQWRLISAEPHKSMAKKQQSGEKSQLRLHFFAIDGYKFNENPLRKQISIADFTMWHLPIEPNLTSTDMKLFSRMQLGLSKTTATVVLEPHEFIRARDVRSVSATTDEQDQGRVMTDGCARMSFQLAQAVWSICGTESEPLPSAFQARISGAKGLWIVDYVNTHPEVSDRNWWIEITDSQLKIQPHPSYRLNAEPSLRTFEVLRTSSPCQPAYLNIQLINILHNRGVPRETFDKAIRADLGGYLDDLRSAMERRFKLRAWMHKNHNCASFVDKAGNLGSMPRAKEDEINKLLESGFEPNTCQYLKECIWLLLKQKLDTYTQKLRIRIRYSTSLLCIPDPMGILKEGEIQVNLSGGWEHPYSKLYESSLEGLDVLASRNPAMLPSDVQKVKGVFYHELRHLKDVAIFSTQGERSLASMLSGGDYDGDIVTLIWNPQFTSHFQNVTTPSLPRKSLLGIEVVAKPIYRIFNFPQPEPTDFDEFFRTCCLFNGRQNKLGEVTAFHEKVTYAKSTNIESDYGTKLAALAGYLVDSYKQGDSFSDHSWTQLRKQITISQKPGTLRDPAFKRNTKPKRDSCGDCINIIDHLKFTVVAELRSEALRQYDIEYLKDKSCPDSDLSSVFRREFDVSSITCGQESETRKTFITELRKALDTISAEWRVKVDKYEDGIPSDVFVGTIDYLYGKLQAVEPVKINHEIRRDFEREGGGKGTRWSLLRASCFHRYHPTLTLTWKLVGDELCRIKARSLGPTWEMTPSMRNIMKIDTKKVERVNGADSVSEDDNSN